MRHVCATPSRSRGDRFLLDRGGSGIEIGVIELVEVVGVVVPVTTVVVEVESETVTGIVARNTRRPAECLLPCDAEDQTSGKVLPRRGFWSDNLSTLAESIRMGRGRTCIARRVRVSTARIGSGECGHAGTSCIGGGRSGCAE